MHKDEMKAVISRVKSKIRVTKVVATRSVKTGNRGDFFAGFATAWDTRQDDQGGPGADLDMAMETSEIAESGMTLQEAKIAQYLVAMQADIAAYEAAYANGGISGRSRTDAISAIKSNYGGLIAEALGANK